MKILHLADIHAREKDIEEIEKCLDCVVKAAIKENVDLAIIAGDCFDSRDIKLDSLSAKLIIKTISELAEICPVAVVIGTPSHDGTAAEIAANWKDGHGVTVASRPIQVKYINGRLFPIDEEMVTNSHAIISLIPTPTKQFFQTESGISESNAEISMAMNGIFAGFGAKAATYDHQLGGAYCPHILVGHWQVAGSIVSTGQTLTGHDIDIGFDQMMLANPDLICLGHIHMPQKLGDRAFYPGSLYPLTWGELETKGFYIHTLEGKSLIKSRFIETPCRKLLRLAGNFTTADENLHYDHNYWNKEEDVKLTGSYLRIDITVWQDEVEKIDKERMISSFKDRGALDVDIRIIRIPREAVRSEAVLKVNTLREKLTAMADLRSEIVGESILIKADLLEFRDEKEQVAA